METISRTQKNMETLRIRLAALGYTIDEAKAAVDRWVEEPEGSDTPEREQVAQFVASYEHEEMLEAKGLEAWPVW